MMKTSMGVENMKKQNLVIGWIKRHKSLLVMSFTALSFLIALAGSFQYYSQVKYAGEVVYDRLLSTVLFSVLKLYAFSPTVSVGVPTPLCYEIAKWLAPLCTGYWLLRALEAMLRQRMEMISRRFRRKDQILVIGYNEESAQFLSNLGEENLKKRLDKEREQMAVLVPLQILEQERKLQLERERVLVKPPLEPGELAGDESFARQCLKNFGEVVLFEADSPGNFTILKHILDRAGEWGETAFEQQRKARWAVRCENRVLKRVMENYYDEFPGRKPFELRLFSMAQMAAEELFFREPIFKNCLERVRDWMKEKSPGAREIMEQIPNPHLLIAGFGRFGQAVFEEALLSGTLSFCSRVEGYERLRITIIDRQAEKCCEMVESRYPRIHKICQVEYISASIDSVQVERKLRMLPPVTYAAVCFSDQATGVEAAEKLRWYFTAGSGKEEEETEFPKRIPIAVRMQSNGSVLRFLMQQEERGGAGRGDLVDFGSGKRILNRRGVIGSRLEEEAKDFNWNYCRIRRQMEGDFSGMEGEDREELWNGLNFEQRESNRAQVKNRPYMQELLKILPALLPVKETFQYVKDTDRFLKALEEGEILDVLAAQEHVRWCNFHYGRGYVGRCQNRRDKGKVRRIQEDGEVYCGKVHNCLIDRWEDMKKDLQARNTIAFDVCGIYGYLPGEGENV